MSGKLVFRVNKFLQFLQYRPRQVIGIKHKMSQDFTEILTWSEEQNNNFFKFLLKSNQSLFQSTSARDISL